MGTLVVLAGVAVPKWAALSLLAAALPAWVAVMAALSRIAESR